MGCSCLSLEWSLGGNQTLDSANGSAFIIRNMKKTFCLFAVFIFTVCINAQSDSPVLEQFFLTGNGSFQTINNTNYIVIEYEGKTQETLFNEYLVAITKLYNNPNDECLKKNWIGMKIRLLTQVLKSNYSTYHVIETYDIDLYSAQISQKTETRPTLYLLPDTEVKSGSGKQEDPYILK